MRYSHEYKLNCIELYRQGIWPETPEGIIEHNFRIMIGRYAKKYKDYKFFESRLEFEYLPTLLKLLEKYKPEADSLGLRVKNLIEIDLYKIIEQLDSYSPEFENSPRYTINRQIITASSSYIVELENIAKLCATHNISL